MDKLADEIDASSGALSVFTSSTDTPISLLKQTALYLNQFVINDPLFHYTNLDTPMEKVMSNQLGFPDKGLNKDSVANAAQYLKTITPMVTGNFVKVYPLDLFFETPDELPLKMPVNNNQDLLPPDIRDYFLQRAQVSNMEKMKNGGWAIIPERELKLGRAINIEFEGSMYDGGLIYFLNQIEVVETNEKEGTVKFIQTFPDTLPAEEEFKNWVIQSVNSGARSYFDRTCTEMQISARLSSSYLARNELTADLISRNFGRPASIPEYTAQQMLNIDLPFLQKIDVAKIMQVRETDSNVFTTFRFELEKQFRELRTITDPKIMEQKAQNIFHELNEVQVHKIQQKIKHINKQMFINTSLAVGGLIGSVPTSGFSLAGTILAMVKGYKDYNEYVEKVKENPAYFLWKVKS